jgi:sterol desaturase/sphingolipid hydroxylase (fatty acid hydroxylase superfamily)
MLQAFGTWLATVNLILLIVAFLGLAFLEVWRPKREHRLGLGTRWTTNLGLQVINSVLADLLLPLAAVTVVSAFWTPAWRLTDAAVGALPVLLLTMLALDLAGYALHRAQHAALPLWRLHVVHHSDTDLDTSTGFRHHPLEYLVSIVVGIAVIGLLGLPPWAVSIYAALALIAGVAQHANLVLPPRLDRWLRYALVTPAMHEVHHSVDPDDHDCNFGTVFSFWDRLFRTYRAAPAAGADQIRFGVEPFTAPRFAAPHWALLLPLKIRRRESLTLTAP